MASPSINGQLGWNDGFPNYRIAWDHHKYHPSISQKIKLEYPYPEGEKFVEFSVGYLPANEKGSVQSYDGLLTITADGSWYSKNGSSLYIAIAKGYADETVDPPKNLEIRDRPYYITALDVSSEQEVTTLSRTLRFQLNEDASLDKLYHLATYTDYKGQQRQFWTPVDELSNIQYLGVYAIMSEVANPNGVQG